MGDAAEDRDDAQMVLYSIPGPRGVRWMAVAAVALTIGVVAFVVNGGYSPFALMPVLVPVALMVRMAIRPPSIELGGDGLTVTNIRSVYLPYNHIERIEGDVPSDVRLSTQLFVRRSDGGRIALPKVRTPLVEVYELVTARLPRG